MTSPTKKTRYYHARQIFHDLKRKIETRGHGARLRLEQAETDDGHEELDSDHEQIPNHRSEETRAHFGNLSKTKISVVM